MLKKIKISTILIIIGITSVLYIGGRLFIFHQLENVIRQELADLKNQGVEINVKGLQVGPWQNRVLLDSVHVRFIEGYGIDNFVEASSGAITLHGIALLHAVLTKKLRIQSVTITQPFIQTKIVKAKAEEHKTVKNSQNPEFKKLFIRHLKIKEGKWRINDNTKNPIRVTTLDEIYLTNFYLLNNSKGPLQWRAGKTHASNILITLPKDFYSFYVKEINYNADAQELNIDTVKLTPLYNKQEFAERSKKENTRLTVVIPYIKSEQCNLKSNPEFTLNAAEVRLQLYLESYLDKRYLFDKAPDKILPVEFIQKKLPLTLHIDTLRVEDSYAEHEEFPEIGDETGKVFFTKLNATLANLTTEKPADKKHLPTLSATALFMGIGDLRAEFGFPGNPNGNYYASGAMYNFPFTKLNKAIEPLAKARIESGQLNWIKFNFKYDNDRSDGQVEMNYNNLKVLALKKDDPDKKAGFKNFILNTFILKKNLDGSAEVEDRSGTIQFYRDRRRSLFNYWWKSVLSGVLSVYSIDKVPEPKDRAPKADKK